MIDEEKLRELANTIESLFPYEEVLLLIRVNENTVARFSKLTNEQEEELLIHVLEETLTATQEIESSIQ